MAYLLEKNVLVRVSHAKYMKENMAESKPTT